MSLLSESIRLKRTEKKINQQELAKRVGISPAYMCRIENGKDTPSIDLVDRINKVLGGGLIGASVADFSNNEDNMMLMLFEHVAKYYIPEKIDLKSVLEDNPEFYNDTKELVVDVIKNRFNYYINKNSKPNNQNPMPLSKLSDE